VQPEPSAEIVDLVGEHGHVAVPAPMLSSCGVATWTSPSTRPSRATTRARALVPPTSMPIAMSPITATRPGLQLAQGLGLDALGRARLDEGRYRHHQLDSRS